VVLAPHVKVTEAGPVATCGRGCHPDDPSFTNEAFCRSL
jgi:hypothetical protein